MFPEGRSHLSALWNMDHDRKANASNLSTSTIFNLPYVINHMPRHASHSVTRVPTAINQLLAGRGLAQHICNLFPHSIEGALVVYLERLVPYPDLARINPLGFDDVTPDLVSIATPATRTFAQFLRERLRSPLPVCPRTNARVSRYAVQ